MKFFIAMFALASSYSFACSPELPVNAQLRSMNRILNSPSFKAQLNAAVRSDFHVVITRMEPNGSEVSLSNGCAILSHSIFKPVVDHGMCPEFEKVVSHTICQ